jgi:salicylate hydroxylase
MAASAPILIAGGGIGGLACALALAQTGRSSLVLERQAEFSPAGAGIQIGPNGVRALRELGVADALEPFAGKPGTIEVFEGGGGRRLTGLPLGDWIAERHGAPYWVAHRGDVHAVLHAAAARNPLIDIRTGFEIASVVQGDGDITVRGPSRELLSAELLVGADGLWSAARAHVAPGIEPVFAGATATRTVIPAARAGVLAMPAVGLWLSPSAHVVHYPLRGGREIAVVAIVSEAWESRAWDTEADGRQLLARLAHFPAPLTQALRDAAGERWHKWALHTLAQLGSFASQRAVLLGDAAHPMLPYLAQGGACALEDALVLARVLHAEHGDVARAATRFDAERMARCHRIQRASVRQGRIYRLPARWSWARDAVLRAVPARKLMAQLDWLYAWRPPQAPAIAPAGDRR